MKHPRRSKRSLTAFLFLIQSKPPNFSGTFPIDSVSFILSSRIRATLLLRASSYSLVSAFLKIHTSIEDVRIMSCCAAGSMPKAKEMALQVMSAMYRSSFLLTRKIPDETGNRRSTCFGGLPASAGASKTRQNSSKTLTYVRDRSWSAPCRSRIFGPMTWITCMPSLYAKNFARVSASSSVWVLKCACTSNGNLPVAFRMPSQS
mmetsp:Transcript_48500/g.113194  ORF Transcript_48500/g.113194 Transcript_48500/m.113194 type:complete len:204 (-) Transcript_48500:923-1534(-)